MEDFRVMLGKLAVSASGEAAAAETPAFRVSPKVAEVMVLLRGSVTSGASRASPYEEEAQRQPVEPPLTLADLKERIPRASSIAELRSLRRRFAHSNHPDRHKPSEEAVATLEMSAANQLIDEAIRSRR